MNGLNMEAPKNERFFSLLGDFQTDIKTFIKKEVELAKAEMGEKFKSLSRNAVFMAIGGVMGLIAVFLLLLGLGAIVAQALQKTDLSPGTAYFISYFGLALILAGVGYALIHKAVNAFSKISLSPEKAIATAKGEEVPIQIKKSEKTPEPAKPSSDIIKSQAESTRARMDHEMAELKHRLSPSYMAKAFLAGIKHHPMRTLLVGASTGLGGYLYWRNRHTAEIRRLNANKNWMQLKLMKLNRALHQR